MTTLRRFLALLKQRIFVWMVHSFYSKRFLRSIKPLYKNENILIPFLPGLSGLQMSLLTQNLTGHDCKKVPFFAYFFGQAKK